MHVFVALPSILSIERTFSITCKMERDKFTKLKGTHFSIVTERSPHACNPASTNEVLSSATCPINSGHLTLSICGDMLVNAFNMSMDMTRHVIVFGTFGIPIPGLTEGSKRDW